MKLLKMLLEETRINEMKMRLVEGTAEDEATKKLDKIMAPFGELGIDEDASEALEANEDLHYKSPKWIYLYCYAHENATCDSAEKVLAKDPEYAMLYVNNVQDGDRFAYPEEAFADNAEYAFEWAYGCEEAWPPGEAAIAKDPNYASQYPRITGDRFEMAEPMLAKLKGTKDEQYLKFYLRETNLTFDELKK